MRRWSFLEKNIPRLLANPYVGELIIIDETGEDYELLQKNFQDPKLRLFKNETRLGSFLNKLECMKKATFDWICLLDSDNFADEDYFKAACAYADFSLTNMLYLPSKAGPFIFTSLQGQTLTPQVLKEIIESSKKDTFYMAMNTGNHLIPRSAVPVLLEDEFTPLSKECSPYCSIYLNLLLMKAGFNFCIVPNMEYEHIVHDGSLFLTETGLPGKRTIELFIKYQFQQHIIECPDS